MNQETRRGKHAPPQRSAAKRKKPQPHLGFHPTTKMRRFLRTELDFLAKRRAYTQKQVAETAHVSESQASRWHDVDGYDEWMQKELRAVAMRLVARATVSAGHRVIQTGDPKELETLSRVMALLAPDSENLDRESSAPHPTVINLLVPRPDPLSI